MTSSSPYPPLVYGSLGQGDRASPGPRTRGLAAAKAAIADARFAAMVAHQEAGEARDVCAAAQAQEQEALQYFEDCLAELRLIAST